MPTPEPLELSPAVLASHLRVQRGDTVILDDLSCSIPRGACTVILGPNGCGKTTLTRALIGQTFLAEGAVTVLDHTLGRTDIRALRRRIGVVNPTTDSASAHQSGAVVDAELSALEAVLTGFFGTVGLYDVPTDPQKQRAMELLTRVGLERRAGLRFALLSTGEQRRCLIARALVHEPELLILDEPTAGLDVAAREQVLAVVHQLLKKPNPPTVLFITHHVEEIPAQTAQVLLMKQGRILAAGRPQEVITPESLSHIFGCKVFVRRLHKRYWLEVLPEAWLDLPS